MDGRADGVNQYTPNKFIVQGYDKSNPQEYWYTHYDDVIMGTVASQITSLTIVYSTVYSDTDQRKHQSSASLACVRGFHRGPVNSSHKWPVTWKMFPFHDVIMRPSIHWEQASPIQTNEMKQHLMDNSLVILWATITVQWSFSLWAQPMTDDVVL